MRLLLGLFCVLLLVSAAGSLTHQQSQLSACGFTVHPSSGRPEVTGPPDLAPLVYVLDQPDSPIEIQSVNLDGSWLSVSGDRYTHRTCAKYHVLNRSDRAIQHVALMLAYNGRGAAGASNSATISAGQTAELIACPIGGSAGTGSTTTDSMKILISVEAVTIEDCAFRPSVRVPLFWGIKPFWL